MIRRCLRSISLSFAALLVAAVSVWSASMLTPPDRDALAERAVVLAFGLSAEDFCGDDAAGHDHSCPFCRLLADPPSADPVLVETQLHPADGWIQLSGGLAPGQPGNPLHPVRAPPVSA